MDRGSRGGRQRRLVTRCRLATALGVIGAIGIGAAAPAALGADSVYWGTYPGLIRVANLDGSGAPVTLFTGEQHVMGIGLDPATGKLYWAEGIGINTIRGGNLDGTGAQSLFTNETNATGLAIDPAAGKLYWDDGGVLGEVRAGNVDGTGANTLYGPGESPGVSGVAIDPASGKIYWANSSSPGAIRVGNLNGSGTPQDLFADNRPEGVAIDAAAGKIYWSTGGAAGTIKVGNLDGSGTPQTLFINQNNPIGVAVDPTAGKIYWVEYGTGSIRVGNIDGSGTPQTLFTGEIQPYFLALLRSPVGAGAPQISGGSTAGSTLTCSQGLWQPDLVGAFLYRAPGSFGYQWSLNGTAIAGAATSSYTTSAPGNYNCQVTGTNPAGSSSQTSAPFAVTAAVHHPAPPPTLTAVAQSHRRWREGNKLAVITRKRRPPVGTTFSFTLNEPASVSFTFSQRVTGRRVKGRCVAQTSKNRHKHACTRSLVRGALSFTGHSGLNRVTFQGRISKHKRLKPGNYTLSITATNAAGQRALAKLTFTIVS